MWTIRCTVSGWSSTERLENSPDVWIHRSSLPSSLFVCISLFFPSDIRDSLNSTSTFKKTFIIYMYRYIVNARSKHLLSIYFMKKATIIRNKIISDTPNTTNDISMDSDIMFNGNMLEMFRDGSEDIIIKSLNKSCHLDPLPIWLLKKCVDQLLLLLTDIGWIIVAVVFEMNHLLKWPRLDREEMKNYCPSSSLPFISNIIDHPILLKRLEVFFGIKEKT